MLLSALKISQKINKSFVKFYCALLIEFVLARLSLFFTQITASTETINKNISACSIDFAGYILRMVFLATSILVIHFSHNFFSFHRMETAHRRAHFSRFIWYSFTALAFAANRNGAKFFGIKTYAAPITRACH